MTCANGDSEFAHEFRPTQIVERNIAYLLYTVILFYNPIGQVMCQYSTFEHVYLTCRMGLDKGRLPP